MKEHPAFTESAALATICKPLEHLNINVFCHTHINHHNEMMFLRNKPDFSEMYHEKKYYESDIHNANQEHTGDFILWDHLNCRGKSSSLRDDARDLGYHQFFTLIKKDIDGKHFYHFATHLTSHDMSQTYLSNIDALKKFTRYFHEKVAQSKELSAWNKIKLKVDQHHDNISFDAINRTQFLQEISDTRHPEFTKQQQKCIRLLLQGFSPKQIALDMQLSYKTIEHYLAHIRAKMHCKTTRELILKLK